MLEKVVKSKGYNDVLTLRFWEKMRWNKMGKLNLGSYKLYFLGKIKPLFKNTIEKKSRKKSIRWEIETFNDIKYEIRIYLHGVNEDLRLGVREPGKGKRWVYRNIKKDFDSDSIDEELKKKIVAELKDMIGLPPDEGSHSEEDINEPQKKCKDLLVRTETAIKELESLVSRLENISKNDGK